MKKRYLVAKFDVTKLTAKQVDDLLLEVVAQGESSDYHPSVPVVVRQAIVSGAGGRR